MGGGEEITKELIQENFSEFLRRVGEYNKSQKVQHNQLGTLLYFQNSWNKEKKQVWHKR
jgi:hypothetical protein